MEERRRQDADDAPLLQDGSDGSGSDHSSDIAEPLLQHASAPALSAARSSFDSSLASLPHEERVALARHAADQLSVLVDENGVGDKRQGLLWTCLYRVRFLAILMVFQSCSGFILDSYSDFIETHLFLTLYLTMLVGAGGNAGNQSAVNVIRGLATGELAVSQARGLLWFETQAGIIEGALLTSICFCRVYIFQQELRSSIAVSLSLFAITAISVVVGAFLPLAFDRCGLDAAHAGPAIQVVMDVLGVFLACSICAAIASDVGVVPLTPGVPPLLPRLGMSRQHSAVHGTPPGN